METCMYTGMQPVRIQLLLEKQNGSRLLKEALRYNDKLPKFISLHMKLYWMSFFFLFFFILSKIVFGVQKGKKKLCIRQVHLHLLSRRKARGTKGDYFHFRSVRSLLFSGYMNHSENYLGISMGGLNKKREHSSKVSFIFLAI